MLLKTRLPGAAARVRDSIDRYSDEEFATGSTARSKRPRVFHEWRSC